MSRADGELVEGDFVIAHVGAHRIAVDVAAVAEVVPTAADSPAGLDAESLFGLPRSSDDRVVLVLRRDEAGAELEVPGRALEIGRPLRGACHAPRLVARALERCCLDGVVLDGDRFVFLLDLDRFWSRVAETPTEGESS